MNYRYAKKEDIPEIVRIHNERFLNFFLTSLGSGFLNTFYTAFLRDPGILIVLEDDNKIVGFAAGSKRNIGFFKKLLKNNFFGFVKAGIKIILSNPKSLKRLATNAKKSEKLSLEYSELLSIATIKNHKGYGKSLLHFFELEVSNNKIKLPLSLTTDFDNNKKAVQFYLESNYEELEVFESYQGRKMYRFIKYNI